MSRTIPYITVDELGELLFTSCKDSSVQIIDVRDDDFIGGHIPGARNLPSTGFATGVRYLVQELAESEEVVIFHCMFSQERGPSCAKCFLDHLAELHPESQCKVRILHGGFNEWDARFGRTPDTLHYIAGRTHDLEHTQLHLGQKQHAIKRFMNEVNQTAGKYCFGISNTVSSLEKGAVDTLIVWEGLTLSHLKTRNPNTNDECVHIVHTLQDVDKDVWHDVETGAMLDIVETTPFVQWIVQNCTSYGAKLELISDQSKEGHQFIRGFGGIGGILHYHIDFGETDEHDKITNESNGTDSDWTSD